MENNLNTNEELEQFLLDEVSRHRMYPSEHVWENIRTELHGTSSWPALPFIAIFIIVALTLSTIYNYPPKDDIQIKKAAASNNKPAIGNASENVIITTDSNAITSLDQEINPTHLTNQTIAAINTQRHIGPVSNVVNILLPAENTTLIQDPPAVSAVAGKLLLKDTNPVSTNNSKGDGLTGYTNSIADIKNNNTVSADDYLGTDNIFSTTANGKTTAFSKILMAVTSTDKDENLLADSYLTDFKFEPKKRSKKELTRFEWQVYATPSISYRKLNDDNERLFYINATSGLSLSQNAAANVNTVVRHKPALGMEVGVGILYSLTKNLKFKTGLQFNVRQYYIDAYSSPYSLATISYVQNNHLDSVNVLSSFRNGNGYLSTKLDNKLYQVSIPIGVQWDFIDGKRFGINAGISFQPTFTLNKNVFLISTDYKYYANGAPFFRKWNANTSIELNFTYKTKNTTWFAGPQVRYQHLPTYNDLYPIKEYRWDYGLKIGFTKPIR